SGQRAFAMTAALVRAASCAPQRGKQLVAPVIAGNGPTSASYWVLYTIKSIPCGSHRHAAPIIAFSHRWSAERVRQAASSMLSSYAPRVAAPLHLARL